MNRCVVRLMERLDEPDPVTGDMYPTCGKVAIGSRGGFPMCAEHMEMFDPEKKK